ncbi:MAG: hypothetical protein ABIT07_07610 [Ferruginibacter sp.]
MAILIIVVIAIGYFSREYFRKPTDVLSLKTSTTIDATALIQEFRNDEEIANAKYLGKTIEVRGRILEVFNEADTMLNIFLGDSSRLNKVSCLMDVRYFKKYGRLMPGSLQIIKGVCTGFLMDVELNRCIIIK